MGIPATQQAHISAGEHRAPSEGLHEQEAKEQDLVIQGFAYSWNEKSE